MGKLTLTAQEAREILGCDPCDLPVLRPISYGMNGSERSFYMRADVEAEATRLRDAHGD